MSIDFKPLVTMFIPSYNHQDYIEDAVLSIINQTYENIELIVIDDGSSDNSPLILENLAEIYEFQLIIRENKGLAYTINEALSISHGEYFSGCASDDKLIEDKIARQIKFMIENKEYAMCYGKVIEFDNFNNYIKVDNKFYRGGDIFCDLLRGDFFIPAITYLVKKDIIASIGYDTDFYIDDLQMWLKIAEKHKIGFINEYLAYYRKHDNYMSGKLLKMQESEEMIIKQYKDKVCYKEAINEWNLRWLHNTSSCYKLIAIKKYLLRVIKLKNIFRLKLYKALIRLLIPCALQK